MEKIKGFKGFDKDLKCRGFQYEVGKEYEQKGKIVCCDNGFHFCEDPFDALDYYHPTNSRYCEVEGEGEIDRGAKKVAVSHIHIGNELNWNSFINACVRVIFDKVNWNSDHIIKNAKYSVAKNKGEYSYVTNKGNRSVAMNTGYNSVAENNEYGSVSMNSDTKSVATNTGECSVAMNDGYKSVAMNSGYCSVAENIGNKSVAMNVGDCSTAKVGYKDSVAIVIGKNCKAAGVLDSWLVLTERDCNSEIVGMKAVKVDGTTIKADTYYALRNGEIVEVNY